MATKKKQTAKKKKKTTVKKKRKTAAKAKPAVTKNYLMMILDESGSMSSIKQQAINAFNEQIQTVKKVKDKIDVAVSLVKFESDVSIVLDNVKIDSVEELNQTSYNPSGGTAMYDGVGKALELLKARPDINDEGVTVLVLIISDGEENSSKIYKSEQIAGMVSALQATGRWTFTYAGANQDLSKVSKSLGIPMGNMSVFQATAGGMSANNSLRSLSTQGLYASYSTGETQTTSFYNQTQDKKDDDSTTP